MKRNMTIQHGVHNFSLAQDSAGNLTFVQDADEGRFFDLQLQHIKAKIYEAQYPEFIFMNYFPVSRVADKADESISYYMFDHTGMASIVHPDAEDIPMVDVYGQKRTIDIFTVSSGYGFSYDELWKSIKANANLPMRKANAAREEIERKIELLGWYGDSDWGIVGLLGHPNITISPMTAGATSGSSVVTGMTPLENLKWLNEAYSTVRDITEEKFNPDAFFLPIKQYDHLSVTPLSADNPSRSILDFWKGTHPEVKTIKSTNRLKDVANASKLGHYPSGALTGSSDCAVFCVLDEDVITYELPLSFTQLETQLKGLKRITPCIAKVAGVMIVHPLTVYVKEGI